MKFIHHNIGYRKAGDVVLVTLSGSAANVCLMDSSNFSNYKAGRRFSYIGGLFDRSPARLQIPSAGNWHVTVDMRGLRGTVRSSVQIIPYAALSPLSPAKEAPLRSIPSLVRRDEENLAPVAAAPDGRVFDVFISHASEDKEDVVRPLAVALQSSGLSVWYDEFELRIGDSLRRKIDKGLSSSRFGVVVLSKNFFGKGWPEYELDGLVTRAVSKEQILLPIWHNVSKREVIQYSASLADRLARSTSTHTVEEIADEIVDVIRQPEV